MKTNNYILNLIAFFLGMTIFTACSDMERDFDPKLYTYPKISVEDFSPKEGKSGQEVVITGQNFGDYAEAAAVYFNGVPSEDIVSIENSKIVTKVPNGATSGIITVKVWTHIDSTNASFTVLPSGKITGMSPTEGEPGDQVTILGENFGTNADDVAVMFRGGKSAEIISVEDTKIVVVVPEGGSTGAITLQLGPQTLTGPVFSYPLVGLNFHFDTDGDSEGWVPQQNATYEVSGGNLNVTFDPGQFGGSNKRRADLQLQSGTKIHAGNFPIVAIKFDKPKSGNLTLDTDFGSFGNGANKWTGILIGDVYYFDLSEKPFVKGGVETFLPTNSETELSTFQFKIADITSDETGYSVDWIRSFEDMEALKEAVALPKGKLIYEFDNEGDNEGWVPNQGAGWQVENGELKVTFAQTSGNKRADLALQGGVTMHTGNYPILAMKFTKPAGARVTFDTNRGEVGNGFNRYYTDFEDQEVYYWNFSEQEIKGAGPFVNEELEFTTFQFKIADIPESDPALGYEVDWIRSFESVDALADFINN